MADYIDREALKEAFEQIDVDVPEGWKGGRFCNGFGRKVVNEVIDSIPSFNVEPVRHGRWENCFEDWRQQIEGSKCSACGFEYYGTGISRFRYCPNCGLPMDGGADNG